MTARIGAAYFGSRILRHVDADMVALAEAGFDSVLHTYSEEDQRHYHEQMAAIVATSRAHGLSVSLSPFGVGGLFGGEAASYAVAELTEATQIAADGSPLPALCPNRPATRQLLRRWIEHASSLAPDELFWDEPHWNRPGGGGLCCYCGPCVAAFEATGGDVGDSEARRAFHESSLVELLTDCVAATSLGEVASTICLLPHGTVADGIDNWRAVATIDGLATLATDPYWQRFAQPVEEFVTAACRDLTNAVAGTDVTSSLWIQGFGLGAADVDDIYRAVAAARREGVADLWVWSFDASAHMSSLGTTDGPIVWKALTAALTGAGTLDAHGEVRT